MQLGSFKSVLGGFLSQLGFSPWPGAFTTVSVPNTPGRRTHVVGFNNRQFEVARQKRLMTVGVKPGPEFIP